MRLTFYAEDPLSGDVTQETIAVGVQVQDDSGQTFVPSPLAAPGLPAAAIPLENTWDEDTNATLPVTIIIPQYYKLSNSITVRVTDFTGQLLLEEPVDTTNVVDRITVMLRSKKLPPTVTAGLKILTFTDNLTRKIIAKNKFMMAPKIMVPNMKKRL